MAYLAQLLQQKQLLENGELSFVEEDEIEQLLADNQTAIVQKVDNIVYVLEFLDDVANKYKEKADYFKQLSKKAESESLGIQKRIANALGDEVLVGSEYKIKADKRKESSVITSLLTPEEKRYAVTMDYEMLTAFKDWAKLYGEHLYVVKEVIPGVMEMKRTAPEKVMEELTDVVKISPISRKDILKHGKNS